MPSRTSWYEAGSVCVSPTAPTPTLQVRKMMSRPSASGWPSSALSIARTCGTVVTLISER
ncbi:hypothetical protein [Actinomadura verrucosospora]|uniref:hypothetical protein n=1 Tax=Actinomadura verrucosospora TaxID=46165 RepID=UPI001FE962A1|nr:hypothetical protein [Actinomadura verrucosospora]